jgi:regulation of enolase protein 1 (concanavalin A-like superfamily)
MSPDMETSTRTYALVRALAALLVLSLVAAASAAEATDRGNVSGVSASHVPFVDVAPSQAHGRAIEAMAEAGLTAGCAADRFCPSQPLSRAQMASILARGFGLPAVATNRFLDVRPGSTHAGNINALVGAGFAKGCADSRFCPEQTLTRAQAASILVAALGLRPTGLSSFSDLQGGVHDQAILALADEGLSYGCSPGRFCGSEPLSRAQFASLLYRATKEGTVELANRGRGDGQGGDGTTGGQNEAPDAGSSLALARSSIGSPSPSGSLRSSNGVHVLSGAGSDIWGTRDSFEFAHRTVSGDVSIVARVRRQSNIDPWAKAGLMIRGSEAADAPHVSLFQTPANGVALQYRERAGASSGHRAGPKVSPPTWLRLDRSGDDFRAYTSEDGVRWTLAGTATVSIAAVAFVGFAVTSRLDGRLSEAEFTDLGIVAPTGGADVPSTPPAVVDVGRGAAFAALLSEDELAVQRHRMVHGPFRAAGDFSANSPGHWNEMAATMKLDFSAARWQGPTGIDSQGRVTRGGLTNDPPGSVRQMAHDMMSAAYAAAITGNHTVAAAITKEIEYQATRPNLDYSNRTLWPFNYYDDINPLFMHTVWVKDYVLAYDITKAMGHSSPIVERWFLDLAELSEQAVHANLSRVFPNRKNGSYSSRASFVNSTLLSSTRTADGKAVEYPLIMLYYNNRRSNQAGFYGLVGVVLDNTRYKEEFKRYGREWLMFGHRVTSSDGLNGDTNRGTDSFPQLGFSYGLHAMESLIPAMDGLARQGDTSLYEFSSSDGAATPTGGTNHYKTMEGVLDTYIRWIKGSYPAQYTASGEPPPSSITGNAYYRIQSRNTGNGREIVNDASLLLPANYYNRTDWHDVIMRKGTPTGFSTAPQGVGSIGGWRTDWRHRFLRSLDTNPYPTRR